MIARSPRGTSALTGERTRPTQARRRREREDKILAAWEAERDRAVAEAEAQQQEAVEKLMAEGRSKKRALEMARTVEPRVPPKPDVESITVSSSGEEVPMYFTEPHQLLDLFTNLEEKTLFLIQNSQVGQRRQRATALLPLSLTLSLPPGLCDVQETEQALEELRQQYDQKRGQMDSTAQELEQQIDALRSQIAEEEAKAEALKRRTTGGCALQEGCAPRALAHPRIPAPWPARRRTTRRRCWTGCVTRCGRCTSSAASTAARRRRCRC